MSKEFENIDQLFQSELGRLNKTAPASVKKGVNKAIANRYFKIGWFVGATSVITIALLSVYLLSPTSTSIQPLLGKTDSPNTNKSFDFQLHESSADYATLDGTKHPSPSISDQNQKANFNSQSSNGETNNFSTKTESDVSTNSINSDLTIKLLNENVSAFDQTINVAKKPLIDKVVINPIEDDLGGIVKDEVVILEKTNSPISNNVVNSNNQLTVDSLNSNERISEIDTSVTESLVAIIDTTLEDPDISFENQKEAYSPWFFTLSAGVNLKKSAFETNISGDESAYGNQLNDKIGHSALFETSYRLKNSLTFGAGIGYTALYENFNYYKADLVVTDTNYVASYFLDSIPDSTGGWDYFTDSIVSPDYVYGANEYYNANGTNSTTYLNIPIKIGTQLIFNKWRLDLFAGGRLNLLLASRSTYVENNQLVYSKNTNFKNAYFDLTFGASAHIEIYNNLFLTATARYRPPLRSAYYSSEINNRFQNTYFGMGLSIGL